MRRLTIIALSLLVAVACSRQEPVRKNVLVLHTYDENFAAYADFGKNMRKRFLKAGVDADIVEICLNSENYNHIGLDEVKRRFTGELDSLGFVPDIILTDEDRAIEPFFVDHDGFRKYFDIDNTPIVAAGVHFPEWHDYSSMPNLAVISDPVAYTENIELALEFTGQNLVEVELDFYEYDNLIRNALRDAISRPPYIDNTDLHDTRLSPNDLTTIFKDYKMVLAISAAYPDRNTQTGNPRVGLSATRGIYTFVNTASVLLLKQDMYGTELLDKAVNPQFTTVNCCFADGRAKTLCGYFTSWETIENDLVDCALRIFSGTAPSELGKMQHTKGLYMDWQAMRLLGLKYKDYKIRFEIVGAPFKVRRPVLYILLSILAVALFCMTVVLGSYLVYKLLHRKRDALYHHLRKLEEESDIVLAASKGRVIYGLDDLYALRPHVHPDHDYELNRIIQAYKDGEDGFSQNVYLSFDGGMSYRWWDYRMKTTGGSLDINADGVSHETIHAILVDNDEAFRRRRELAKARDISEEAVRKENFIMNISHELRTPLNAIVGFSQILSTMADDVSSEERKEYGRYISENSETLDKMVGDVLQFSMLEAGRVDIVPAITVLSEFMAGVTEDWAKKATSDVKFVMNGGRTDIVLYTDASRLREVLDQVLSNAFKFTSEGAVTLWWSYNIGDSVVEMFVEDTGCGMSEAMTGLIFDLFWKRDEFVPGVGIGLSIAKSYIEMLGGTMDVNSREGVGTRVKISCPAEIRK